MLIAAVGALIYGGAYCWRDSHSWWRSVIKAGSVALLAVGGWSMGAPLLVVLGLGLGAAGDFCLSRPGSRAFLGGMKAFAVGHLAYAAYFWGIGEAAFGPTNMAVVALTASTELWLAPHTGALRWPVRGYVVVIAVMAMAAIGQSVSLILLGAVLFLLSDVLLALVLFVPRAAPWRVVFAITLWASYWTGQFLILQGGLSVELAA
jgi:uncharacterized membrane protein YhhN